MSPPFRAEHIGSLKRPQILIEARAKFKNGAISASELEAIEDIEIKRIVKMQRDLGFSAITDGEFRRNIFLDGFFENLEGFTFYKDASLDTFMDYHPSKATFKSLGISTFPSFMCTGKIHRRRSSYVPWFIALAKEVAPDEVKNLKISLIAPEWYHLRHGKYAYTEEAYTSDAEYFGDLAKAYREEIDALYDAGCRNIQIDACYFTYFCFLPMIEGMNKAGIDPDALLDSYIQLYNDCLASKKADMNVGLHLCRGNFKGGVYFVEGGYDAIAVKLFNQLHADCYYLEYDTPRAGSFEALRHVPKDKHIVLGLISTKIPTLEDPAEIISRIEQAAHEMGDPQKQRISLSPQCGFSSVIDSSAFTEQGVEQKLALVADIAKRVWGTTH